MNSEQRAIEAVKQVESMSGPLDAREFNAVCAVVESVIDRAIEDAAMMLIERARAAEFRGTPGQYWIHEAGRFVREFAKGETK